MATVYRCDRCKNESTQRRDMSTVTVEHDEDRGLADQRTDLCESCVRQLDRWLKEAPPSATRA